MHIVVNTLSVMPDRGGVKTYLLNLLDSLSNVVSNERITLLCSVENKSLFDDHSKNQAYVEREVLPLRTDSPELRVLYDQTLVPWHCRKYKNAVLLNPANAAILLSPLPEVVIIQAPLTVHSIRNELPSKVVAKRPWTKNIYSDAMLPLTLWRAEQVIAVSEYIRSEIVNVYPWSDSKIRTVHEGVDRHKFETDGEAKSESALPYFLFVSTLYPYKKADQAIKAFASTVERWEGQVRLKVAGKDPGGQQQRLKQLARNRGINDQVDMLGAVPHERMPSLYREAIALLFPSIAESFGLPILEAMASETPVIASNRMSVPEVVGEAGLIVDPDDTEALATAMCRILDDEPLRDELEAAGRKRVQSFTWRRTARGVRRALKDAHSEN